MKIRLKVSVKVRGGQVFVPGVYDSEKVGYESLFSTLPEEDDYVFEVLTPSEIPAPVEEDFEEETDGEEETEEIESDEESEEVEEKPKKKKKKKKVS